MILQKLDQAVWDKTIDRFPAERCDIFFTARYYRTWTGPEQGDPVCLAGVCDGIDILYPFFLREITEYQLPHACYDVSSAYGYGGMVTAAPLSDGQLAAVDKNICDWMTARGVVAEFIREHPLVGVPLPGADRFQVRSNVLADTTDLDTAWANIEKKSGRAAVKRAQQLGLTLEIDETCQTMAEFSQLYAAKAVADDWDQFYHFTEEYFQTVGKELGRDARIVRVVREGELYAAALTFRWGSTLHNHLAASSTKGQKDNANDLLYWGLIKLANQLDCWRISFGGGLSNDPGDSLFRFKKKYGKIIVPVSIGRRVHDQTLYDAIKRQWAEKYPQLTKKSNMLLCYREVV